MGNMRIITGSTGTTHVTSDDDRGFNAAVAANNNVVLGAGNQLAYTIVDNNTITIADGDILLQGCHARISYGLSQNVSIGTGALGLKRVDLICARYTLNTETGFEAVDLHVIQGTGNASQYIYPEYEDGLLREGAIVSDFPLYAVKLDGINIDTIETLFDVLPSIENIASVNEFTIATSAWGASTASADYAYEAAVLTNMFGDDFIPMYIDMVPADGSAFFSEDEKSAKAMLNQQVVFSATGFTVYANDAVPCPVKLRICGRR